MIRVLRPEVVDKIAAGEVVERPFSVVKELVENSLDAGATRIAVDLVAGGRELIRVRDDGAGFAPEDLPLAFVSHATSKLSELEDLDCIASLGFRGEALASIGSISRATIRSRRVADGSGHEIACEGGRLAELRPCGCPPGTVVEIRDLFFNTPARQRFLRTADAERARIEELLARLALARLDVDFTLIAEGRERLRLVAGESLRERVVRVFGARVGDLCSEVDVQWDDHRVQGLIGSPDIARRDQALGLLYVNGRLVRDRNATQAIRQAYRAFVMPGMQPVFVLHLAMPPAEVDVNVHPTKAEVRFQNSRRVCGLLHEAAQQGLRAHGNTTDAAGPLQVAEDKPRAHTGFPDLPRDLFAREIAAPSVGPSLSHGTARVVTSASSAPSDARPNPFAALRSARFLQVMDLYLLMEGRDGVVVVDQHALHERVLYERLLRRHAARGAAAVQRLLVPEVIELQPVDKEWLLAHRGELAEEGLLLDDFGGRAIAVHGMPAVLGRCAPRALVEDLLGDGAGSGEARPRAHDAVVERFHSMACRAAVMSGDRLHDDEIAALLEEAATLEHPHNCPHGRPTVLTFTAAELERFFRRRGGPSCGTPPPRGGTAG
ncbi:MAG: DNA mismatch repair endonuclease MutL [Planctomycetota bacterium]